MICRRTVTECNVLGCWRSFFHRGLVDLAESFQCFYIVGEEMSGCSFHSFECHPDAVCEDIDDPPENFRCVCPEGATGDGLGENGCVFRKYFEDN